MNSARAPPLKAVQMIKILRKYKSSQLKNRGFGAQTGATYKLNTMKPKTKTKTSKGEITKSKLLKVGFDNEDSIEGAMVYRLYNAGDDHYITYYPVSKIFELTLHNFEGDDDDMNVVTIFIDDMDELKSAIKIFEGYTLKIGESSFRTGLTKKQYFALKNDKTKKK